MNKIICCIMLMTLSTDFVNCMMRPMNSQVLTSRMFRRQQQATSSFIVEHKKKETTNLNADMNKYFNGLSPQMFFTKAVTQKTPLQTTQVVSTNYSIKFPSSGYQPTPTDAVIWSCANINDDNITNWYLSMFGLSQHNRAIPEVIGYKRRRSHNIIYFDHSMDASVKYAFIQSFRDIAGNSVGRVLLYRLLIETKNNSNKITIKKSNSQKFGFVDESDSLYFYPSSYADGGLIGNKLENTNFVDIIPGSNSYRPCDIGIFHELLHWYHKLNNPGRRYSEKFIAIGQMASIRPFNNIFMESHTPAYWMTNPLKDHILEKNIKLEEMRTILGYTTHVAISYGNSVIKIPPNRSQQCDDLSENLYRLCKGYPLRYGHTAFVSINPPPELLSVIKRVITHCKESAKSGGYKIVNAPVSLGKLD